MSFQNTRAHAAGEAGASPPPAASRSMGELVTPHAPITGPKDYKYLVHGIDTLDMGFYVEWSDWNWLFHELHARKQIAQGRDGSTWKASPAGPLLVLPGGKASGYLFHIQQQHYHIFIATPRKRDPEQTDSAKVVDGAPNVYISIGAIELWTHGAAKCEQKCREVIEQLGGRVERSQVSRCDIAVDFWIDGGLSLDFLLASRVSKSRKTAHNMDDDRLETFYLGTRKSPVQLRIYDKAKQILKYPDKNWMRQVWNCEHFESIWRVEFQLRRAFLREHCINSLDDLQRHLGGLWKYLTGEWASFRLPDDANTTRRTVHPWWQHVQNCADLFGDVIDLERRIKADRPGSPEWYVSHVGGCLLGYAVAMGFHDLENALYMLYEALNKHWHDGERDWSERYAVRSMSANQPLEEAHDDIPF